VEVYKDVESGTSLGFACNSRASSVAASHLIRKASDEFAVPLCRMHHRAAHRASDERAWWKAAGIDPIKIARRLWKHTRVNEGRIQPDQTLRGVGLLPTSKPDGHRQWIAKRLAQDC
jgi:hypothetical protein